MSFLLLAFIFILVIIIFFLYLRSQLEPLTQGLKILQQDLLQAKEGVSELKVQGRSRQALDLGVAQSIKRLEGIIAGTQTKGLAGENILEEVFAKLPPDWQVRNFKVGNKQVEFGLRLPNNLILPIDSKWPATPLLEQFNASLDPEERLKIKIKIEADVLNKVKEVKKYIDPNITVGFGIAVVPDAIYELSGKVQVESFQSNVVLLSYSMFIPYLLLVFQSTLKTSKTIDMQKLGAYFQSVEISIQALQEELEGRFAKALIMLTNTRSDMNLHVSRIKSGMTSLEIIADNSGASENESS